MSIVHRMRSSSVRGLASMLSLVLLGCAKPAPTLRGPIDIETQPIDPDALAQTRAAKRGRSGSVQVAYCIDTGGRPTDIRVLKSLEPEVDALVVRTVEQWRFEPATRDGVPEATCTDYTFDLRFPEAQSPTP